MHGREANAAHFWVAVEGLPTFWSYVKPSVWRVGVFILFLAASRCAGLGTYANVKIALAARPEARRAAVLVLSRPAHRPVSHQRRSRRPWPGGPLLRQVASRRGRKQAGSRC